MKTHANISDIFEYDSSLPVAGGAKRYQPVDMDLFGGMADSRGSYGDDDYMTNSDEEGTITEETTPLKRVCTFIHFLPPGGAYTTGFSHNPFT